MAQVADFGRVQEAVRRAFLPTCYTGSGRPDAAFIIGHTITNRRLVIAPADHSVVHWSILEIAAKLPELVVDNIRYQPRWQDILRLPRRKLAAFGTPNRPRNDPSVTEQLRAMGELLSREILQHFRQHLLLEAAFPSVMDEAHGGAASAQAERFCFRFYAVRTDVIPLGEAAWPQMLGDYPVVILQGTLSTLAGSKQSYSLLPLGIGSQLAAQSVDFNVSNPGRNFSQGTLGGYGLLNDAGQPCLVTAAHVLMTEAEKDAYDMQPPKTHDDLAAAFSHINGRPMHHCSSFRADDRVQVGRSRVRHDQQQPVSHLDVALITDIPDNVIPQPLERFVIDGSWFAGNLGLDEDENPPPSLVPRSNERFRTRWQDQHLTLKRVVGEANFGLEMRVGKVGLATGFTIGQIACVEGVFRPNVQIQSDLAPSLPHRQILVENITANDGVSDPDNRWIQRDFCKIGDSGSLVWTLPPTADSSDVGIVGILHRRLEQERVVYGIVTPAFLAEQLLGFRFSTA